MVSLHLHSEHAILHSRRGHLRTQKRRNCWQRLLQGQNHTTAPWPSRFCGPWALQLRALNIMKEPGPLGPLKRHWSRAGRRWYHGPVGAASSQSQQREALTGSSTRSTVSGRRSDGLYVARCVSTRNKMFDVRRMEFSRQGLENRRAAGSVVETNRCSLSGILP